MANRPRTRHRFILRLTCALLGLALVGTLIWPTNQNALERYVSPSFDETGHQIKLEIPRGWETSDPKYKLARGPLDKHEMVVFRFRQAESRIPQWLRRWFRKATVEGNIRVTIIPRIRDIRLGPTLGVDTKNARNLVFREITSNDRLFEAEIVLVISDRPTFDRLYLQICNNFEIIGGKDLKAR